MADVYHRGPTTVIRLGDGRYLVRASYAGESLILDSEQARVLSQCTRFDSLAGHAGAVAAKLQLSEASRQGLPAMLESFVRAGLLVSWMELTSGASHGHTAAALEWVAVPTRNRPDGLARCLRSHLEHARRFGRRIGGAIVDGSPDPDVRSRNLAVASALAREFGCPVGYAGPEQKQEFATTVARLAGVRVDLVRFALLDIHDCGHDAGANRNALLLGLADRAFLSSDDDVICAPAIPQRNAPGVAFTPAADPTEVTLFASEADAACGAVPTDADLFGCHEALLGRGTADLLRAATPEVIHVSDLEASLLQALDPSSRVTVTSTGLLGDSGALYPSFYAWSRTNVRDQLIRDEERYLDVLLSRQMVRAAARDTVAGGAFFMSTHVGLDNRQLLPPFMPVLRGQDLTFGRMLRLSSERQFIAHLAKTIVHRPIETRRSRPDALWPREPNSSFAAIVGALISRIQAGCSVARPGAPRLRLIATHLRELLAGDAGDRERAVREELWRLSEAQFLGWNDQLTNPRQAESLWGKHLRAMLDDRISVMRSGDPLVPSDLGARMSTEEARLKANRVLTDYADLLEAWPDIRAAAARQDPLAGGLFQPA